MSSSLDPISSQEAPVMLRVEGVSKQYRLGKIGTGTLSHDLNRWWHKIRGKEDPYLKIGETNDRSTKGSSQYVWALQDITFDVRQGEVLGIIGKNGAGKSTLLKILSRVTSPTTGSVKSAGRIASLLEVGTGFHKEMTGRENIYLNGAILGMTKKEIASKLDEIIAFSGCERYIDTPVKRYSSGMTVRLAFAVAAHLDPEILVVDEVLAVGDAEFQKKAIGKMQEISKGGGRTVLFVSHNMAAVQSLCTKAIVIESGTITFSGLVEEAIQFYLSESVVHTQLSKITNRKGNGKVKLDDVQIYGLSPGVLPQTGQPFYMDFTLQKSVELQSSQLQFDLRIDDHMGQRILWMSTGVVPQQTTKVGQVVRFYIPKLHLNDGLYYVTTYIRVDNEVSDWIQHAFSFEVAEGDYYGSGKKTPSFQSKTLFDFNVQYL